MNQKLYEILKAIALIWLPALGTLVFAVTDLWNLEHGAQIVGTIMAVDAFLGAGLGLTRRNFMQSDAAYAGSIVIDTTNPIKDVYSLEMGDNLGKIPEMKEIRLKVVHSRNSPGPGTPIS